MAYNTKYRVTFKDVLNTTVQVDIQQNGWSVGNVTNLTPTGDPLSIQWPGDRDDIFNPVRGAVATLSFYNETTTMFDEFFDADPTEYLMIITVGGAIYWRGWLSLQDYQEALLYPPYVITVRAYDLGYLQSFTWDGQYKDDDTILDVIYRILGYTDLDMGVIERVNLYEDSIASTASDSMLDLINMNPVSFMSASWEGISLYEALSRLLIPFSAFIVQEGDNWNICRIPDITVTHNQRTFAFPQLFTSSGSEDLTDDLSNYQQMDRSALLLSCPTYRRLNITQHSGAMDLVNNANCRSGNTASDYWSGATVAYTSSTYSFGFPTIFYNEGRFLKVGDTVGGTATHEKTYNVPSGTILDVAYLYEVYGGGAAGTATYVTITIKIDDGGTPYYLDMSSGAWSITSTVSRLSFSPPSSRTGGNASLTSDASPIGGVLSIALTDANWTGVTGNTFFRISVVPSIQTTSFYFGQPPYNLQNIDKSETINTSGLESQNVDFYYGDAPDSDTRDILSNFLTIAADGTATDGWGPLSNELLDLTIANYRDQYRRPARRLQCVLRGDLDYLTVIKDSSDRLFLPATIMKDMRRAETDGEWIEIKTRRLLDSILACWELDDTSGSNAQEEIDSGNDGTITGATVNQPGKVGTCYDFNGTTDYISIPPTDFQFNPNSESYTVSVWVKSADPTPGAVTAYVLGCWSGSGGDEYPFLIIVDPTDSDNLRLVLNDGLSSYAADITGASVWDDEWHLLSMVVDDTAQEVRGYLDGVLKDTTSISSLGAFSYSGTYYFHVGTNPAASPSRWYDGLIDQITVHNRALEAKELLTLSEGIPFDEFGI